MNKLRLYYPCKPYRVFQKYAECMPDICDLYHSLGLKGHNGEDVQCYSDTKLYASHDGTVVHAGEDGSSGYLVVIRTDEPYDYNGLGTYFKTLYAHLRKDGLQVKAGQKVKIGDFIALSDNTGISKGAHLHFGLKPVHPGEAEWQWFNLEQDNGYNGAIDPAPYWTGVHAIDVPSQIQAAKNTVASLLTYIAALLAKRRSV